MNSLALSDGVLLLVTLMVVSKLTLPKSFRLTVAVFASAALLGVLRFSGALPLPGMHGFFSGLGASAAYPLLAVGIIWPNSRVANSWRFASIFLVIAGALGLIATANSLTLWGNISALVSVASVLIATALKQKWVALSGGVSLLIALLLFAMKISLPPIIQPGDFLHIFMAIGLALIAVHYRSPAH